MKQWKYERELQIQRRISYFLLFVALLIGAFALGCVVTFEQLEGKAIYEQPETVNGLYAGFTAEDFLSYAPAAVEEKETVNTEAYLDVTKSDYELLAKLVERETGGQGLECMVACASVVINRVNSDKYPNTIKEVIYQRGQYSVVRNERRFNNTIPCENAYYAAELVLTAGSQIPANVLFQGQNKNIGSGVWKIIKGEVYCYE